MVSKEQLLNELAAQREEIERRLRALDAVDPKREAEVYVARALAGKHTQHVRFFIHNDYLVAEAQDGRRYKVEVRGPLERIRKGKEAERRAGNGG